MFRQAPPVLQTPQGVRRHTILHHGAYSRAQQLLISSAEGPNVRIQRVKEAHRGRKTQRLINSRTFLFFLIKRVATIIWQRLEKPSWRPASLTGQKKKKGLGASCQQPVTATSALCFCLRGSESV